VYVECKPDFVLVNLLGVPKKSIIHAGNKSGVCRRLQKSNNSKGLVDEDPLSNQPPYIEKLDLIHNQHGIKIFQDSKNGNHLIVLCPRLEEWILQSAKEVNIDVKKYNLPTDGKKLHKIINMNLVKFKKLIRDLGSKGVMLNTLEKSINEELPE